MISCQDVNKGSITKARGSVTCWTVSMAMMLVVLFGLIGKSDAFSTSRHEKKLNVASKTVFARRGRSNSCSLGMYVYPNTPTSQTAPMVAKSFFSSKSDTHKGQKQYNTRNKNRNDKSALPYSSNSVLVSSNTLLSFPTARGILSPETVMRMEEMTLCHRDEAIRLFLDTYRKNGPMACLPMLSDPCVLPKLTEAMRDITL